MAKTLRSASGKTPGELLDALGKDVKAKAQSKDLYERRTMPIPLGGIAVPLTKIGQR
jgi:hypothetical protein